MFQVESTIFCNNFQHWTFYWDIQFFLPYLSAPAKMQNTCLATKMFKLPKIFLEVTSPNADEFYLIKQVEEIYL